MSRILQLLTDPDEVRALYPGILRDMGLARTAIVGGKHIPVSPSLAELRNDQCQELRRIGFERAGLGDPDAYEAERFARLPFVEKWKRDLAIWQQSAHNRRLDEDR